MLVFDQRHLLVFGGKPVDNDQVVEAIAAQHQNIEMASILGLKIHGDPNWGYAFFEAL
jgi:hypothetical protein